MTPTAYAIAATIGLQFVLITLIYFLSRANEGLYRLYHKVIETKEAAIEIQETTIKHYVFANSELRRAIKYALEKQDLDFLSEWAYGDDDSVKKHWPDFPLAVVPESKTEAQGDET